MKRLEADAIEAAGRAAAAKAQVRVAKVQLKQARKLFKMEKRAAKQARRKVDEASTIARAPRPAAAAVKTMPKKLKPRAVKPRAQKAPEAMRSAAEVAKSVIERLHSPPPILPLTPVIPAGPPPSSGDSASEPGKS